MLAAAHGSYAAAPVTVPQQTALIVDQANALDDNARAALETRLQSIQSGQRAQVAILISSGIGAEPLSDYSLRVAEAWQLGRAGRDNGLLILVVPAMRAARMEVGYGLEGDIPDALASRWIDELLTSVKKRELARGLGQVLDNIEAALPAAADKKSSNDGNYLFPDHPEWRLPFVLVVFSLFS